MNAGNTQDRRLTTEQIAAVDTEPAQDDAGPAQDDAAGGAPGPSAEADLPADTEPRAQLLDSDELQSIVTRWKEIQAEFVDEPRKAVEAADALVAELMQRLAQMFAAERAMLEEQLAGGDGVSTEELRQGLRRYRSFFERLLAA